MMFKCLVGALCFLFALHFSAQDINRFNKKRERTGKWITYTDASHTKKLSEVKYRNGNVVGTAKYYNTEGQLERIEKNPRDENLEGDGEDAGNKLVIIRRKAKKRIGIEYEEEIDEKGDE